MSQKSNRKNKVKLEQVHFNCNITQLIYQVHSTNHNVGSLRENLSNYLYI